MTVEVETPDGTRAGSCTREVSIAKEYIKLPESKALDVKFQGEAVAVDLPGGQVLFALIAQDAMGHEPAGAALWAFDAWRGAPDEMIRKARALRPGRMTVLPPDQYPMLVRFRDLHDPKTVERVNWNELSKAFGRGFKLRQIVMEITRDPITHDIETRLPAPFWRRWSDLNKVALTGPNGGLENPYFQTTAGLLSRGAFTTNEIPPETFF